MWKILPLHSLPSSFFLSVPLFLCFVFSLSPSCSLPLSPSSFPLHAVVCRHAGISGPQNDRPNLSALAPVTKDGRPGSVCAYDWWASELLPVWLVITCLSSALMFCWHKCECQIFVCVKTQFSCVIKWLLSDYNSSFLLFSLLHSFGFRDVCFLQFASSFVYEWGVSLYPPKLGKD